MNGKGSTRRREDSRRVRANWDAIFAPRGPKPSAAPFVAPDPEFTCDRCGHLIPLEELDSGTARRILLTPDTPFSSEDYETLCAPCADSIL